MSYEHMLTFLLLRDDDGRRAIVAGKVVSIEDVVACVGAEERAIMTRCLQGNHDQMPPGHQGPFLSLRFPIAV
jgi:hypothetical protein